MTITHSGPYKNIQDLFNKAKGNIARLQADIDDWCIQSTTIFDNRFFDRQYPDRVWVVKYIRPKYLDDFFDKKQKINVSLGPNYTWGDAVYIAPLYNVLNGIQDEQSGFTSAMFGRAGIVGYLPYKRGHLKVFDATSGSKGVKLYQRWIMQQSLLYDHLTTSVHAHLAKYYLVKIFRWIYNIDIIFFNPDEYNKRYVNATSDTWFAISDWDEIFNSYSYPSSDPIIIPSAIPYSDKIEGCRWIIRVEEDFDRNESSYQYVDNMGKHLREIYYIKPPQNFRKQRSNVYKKIIKAYFDQSANNSPNISYGEQLVLKIAKETTGSI